MTNTLISIVGPTAIGKTALSIAIAKHFNTEIISSDSRQFYKEMTIGTAVPSKEELKAAKHHFIQNKSIEDYFSVGDYERDAIITINQIHKQNPIAIMVGGSGLYAKAVIEGLDDFPNVEDDIRLQLKEELNEKGLEYLQNKLEILDHQAYQTIVINNPQRLIRALEICIGTGKPYSSFLTNTRKTRNFNTISIGLNAERSIIYERINKRVDIMVSHGLIEEVEKLIPYQNLNALNTVGYKELFQYFNGNYTLEFAISEIKKNTRRFAKRQLTWYRKDKTIKWFDYKTDYINVTNWIESKIKKSANR